MTLLALDTSAAVPFLVQTHTAHTLVRERVADRTPVLAAHALAETYSVLTRLPADARLAPADAVTLIESAFAPALLVPDDQMRTLPRVLAAAGIAGGAVYDALVALAARAAGVALLTRDGRAIGTYRALGVTLDLLGP